jgi:hypothetical protein
MTIRWRGRDVAVECDSCDEVYEGERGETWDEVWPRAKREGWKAKKIGRGNEDWVHGCPKHGV